MTNSELIRKGAQLYRDAHIKGDHAGLKPIAAEYPDFASAMIQLRDALQEDDVETLQNLASETPELAMVPIGTWSNLDSVIVFDSPKCAAFLLELGLDPNETNKHTGSTLLSAAASKANLELVKILHEGGAILDTSTMSANPLIGAIHSVVPQKTRGKGLPVAQYLIDAGIDTTVTYTTTRPNPHVNALQFAVEMGAQDIARAIGLHQTGGDEAATQALIDDALRLAKVNTGEG